MITFLKVPHEKSLPNKHVITTINFSDPFYYGGRYRKIITNEDLPTTINVGLIKSKWFNIHYFGANISQGEKVFFNFNSSNKFLFSLIFTQSEPYDLATPASQFTQDETKLEFSDKHKYSGNFTSTENGYLIFIFNAEYKKNATIYFYAYTK